VGAYIAQRLLLAVPTLFGVSLGVFLIIRLIPGDPAIVMAGPQADAQTVANIRRDLGTDQPVPLQYAIFVTRALQGDLGRSFATRQPVVNEIMLRFPRTLLLTVLALILATVVGVSLGVVAAVRPNSVFDVGSMVVAVAGISMPSFWLGLMLIYVFSIRWQLLPSLGMDSPASLVMPTFIFSLFPLAFIARMTRASMLEVLRQDYIRTARSIGLREHIIFRSHALKNALLPVVTIIGIGFGIMLGTAVVVETIFTIDGLGRLIVSSILARDFPVVQGTVLLIATVFVLINLTLDIAYAYLDPRLRLR
jgi:peptide/nickel transport system permease protein